MSRTIPAGSSRSVLDDRDLQAGIVHHIDALAKDKLKRGFMLAVEYFNPVVDRFGYGAKPPANRIRIILLHAEEVIIRLGTGRKFSRPGKAFQGSHNKLQRPVSFIAAKAFVN